MRTPGTTQAVRDVILQPMRELYLPPLHLRRNAEAQTRALAAYERALAGFDPDTLRQAWDKVVSEHTFWGVWPNPGTIATACRQCQPRLASPTEDELRRQQALALAEAYVTRYRKTSHVAQLARREGWAGALLDYVQAAAWVQAQLICQVRNLGWDTQLAAGLGPSRSSAEAFTAYRQTVETPVARGHIRVTVPQTRIRQWKDQRHPQPESYAHV